jgi:hypothetical protein
MQAAGIVRLLQLGPDAAPQMLYFTQTDHLRRQDFQRAGLPCIRWQISSTTSIFSRWFLSSFISQSAKRCAWRSSAWLATVPASASVRSSARAAATAVPAWSP